jgi:hypothetical protein
MLLVLVKHSPSRPSKYITIRAAILKASRAPQKCSTKATSKV